MIIFYNDYFIMLLFRTYTFTILIHHPATADWYKILSISTKKYDNSDFGMLMVMVRLSIRMLTAWSF